MSRAEPVTGGAPPAAAVPARSRSGSLRTLGLFRSELGITFRRWRTLALFGILVLIPVLVGIAVKIETGGGGGEGGGPAFISQVTNNGLFLVFTSLAAVLPFFLPM